MNYSLHPNEVKKTVDKIRNALIVKDITDAQFLYYHLNRNQFNVKTEVKTLTHKSDNKFVDNLGYIWSEVDTMKNLFHMPKINYATTMLNLSKPYSRKFLRDDTLSGINGEFEMIIRHDGKRIDAITNPVFQETYNFGRTRNSWEHTYLDILPHKINPNYGYIKNMGEVKIIETFQ